jgi:hypothetical protein
MENDNLTVGLCSHPPRKEGLLKRVKEILPQLRKDDHFQVYLNNYSPDILKELPKDPRLEVILAGTYINGNIVDVREQYPDLCSFGKLFSFSKWQGYFATIDDDIIYKISESYPKTAIFHTTFLHLGYL